MRLSDRELGLILGCVNIVDAGEVDDLMDDITDDRERERLQDLLERVREKLIHERERRKRKAI